MTRSRRHTVTSSAKTSLVVFLALLAIGVIILASPLEFSQQLRTNLFGTSSTIIGNRSSNTLNTAAFEFSITSPGTLQLKSLRSPAGATVLGLKVSSAKATLSPWVLAPGPYTAIFNQVTSTTPPEAQLLVSFPAGHLDTEQVIATLTFQTTQQGRIDIDDIFLGATPAPITGQPTSFPPQQFAIHTDSFVPVIFDDTGALATPAPTPPVTTQPPAQPGGNTTPPSFTFPGQPGGTITPPGTTPAPTQPNVPAQPLALNPPANNNLVTLTPARKGQSYQFTLQATGGSSSNYRFGLRGQAPSDPSTGTYRLGQTGLELSSTGLISNTGTLIPGNYEFNLAFTDGHTVQYRKLRIPIRDELGQEVGLVLENTPIGTCVVGQPCEIFFRAQNAIGNPSYSFAGESPVTGQLLHGSGNEAFIRFVPDLSQEGVYNFTVTAVDEAGASASNQIALIIASTPFRFSAEESCDFLDLSTTSPFYEAFRFTCQNGIMEGSPVPGQIEKNIRAFDSLNRAEMAKIASLLAADNDGVQGLFASFVSLSPATPVNYQDVTVGDWYAPFVYYLFREGVIIDNTHYRPADTVNVAEAMKFLVEAWATLNPQVERDLQATPSGGEWYEPYQTLLGYLGLPVDRPADPVPRWFVGEAIHRLFQVYPVDKFE